jgi:hypothetical protein
VTYSTVKTIDAMLFSAMLHVVLCSSVGNSASNDCAQSERENAPTHSLIIETTFKLQSLRLTYSAGNKQ